MYGLVVIAIGALIGAGLWGLKVLDRDLTASLDQYAQLRTAYECGTHVIWVRNSLRSSQPAYQESLRRVAIAQATLDSVNGQAKGQAYEKLESSLSAVRQAISRAGDSRQARNRAVAGLNTTLGHLATLVATTREQIALIEQRAIDNQNSAILVMLSVAAVSVVCAGLTFLLHYRGVMVPLNGLIQGVRRFGAGRFHERILPTRDREFAQIAHEFNRMAQELETLYRQLDDKVRTQSIDLSRSERLASVGFLAAGVAHEVNNPLGVIAGEAQLALRQHENKKDVAGFTQTLRVISEEAFRCKQITERLLDLSRHHEMKVEALNVSSLVHDVLELTRVLPQQRGREIDVDIDSHPTPTVLADRLQLRQVLLNLVINALEACPPETGRVTITGRSSGAMGQIIVEDNGRGMDQQALRHAFEPFFTSKRGGQRVGTGLGLSISHSIVRRLGGTLHAHSDGLGKGSRLTLELPVGIPAIDSEPHA